MYSGTGIACNNCTFAACLQLTRNDPTIKHTLFQSHVLQTNTCTCTSTYMYIHVCMYIKSQLPWLQTAIHTCTCTCTCTYTSHRPRCKNLSHPTHRTRFCQYQSSCYDVHVYMYMYMYMHVTLPWTVADFTGLLNFFKFPSVPGSLSV